MGADVVLPTLAHRFGQAGADAAEESPRLYRPIGDAGDRAGYLQAVAAGEYDRADRLPMAGSASGA